MDPRELIRRHDKQAQDAEDAAVAEIVGPVENAFTALWRWLLRTWNRLFGKPADIANGKPLRSFLDDLIERIVGVGLDPVDAMLHHAQRARLLGADQGAREIGLPTLADPGEVERGTREAIERGVRWAQEKLETGAAELDRLRDATLDQVLARASVARQANAILERTARTAWNAELNAGIREAAKASGARLVWVAERDACVDCLAQSGQVIDWDGQFNPARTFGKKARVFHGALHGPPRHPNCRCRVTPWLGHDTEGALSVTHDWADAIKEAEAKGDTVAADAARRAAAAAADSASFDLPASLRREAERSILRGDKLPSESENIRLRAADRLLARIGSGKNSRSPSGWQVPASVKKRAEKAVQRGRFTR
ncbi:hypothetical protein [Amycolatopsis sp. VC5-11]|uniref:hypothetical protein n=1 Tax=Amycolatopsis sp. VC5-11 TaxID=3120156 RepID=UPI00300845C2